MIPLKSGRAVFHSIIISGDAGRARAFIAQGEGRGGEERGSSRQLSNAARSKFLQGTSASFSFFITRELKIETGLDRDPEIDRGHHSYKRHTIQEYSVCTV